MTGTLRAFRTAYLQDPVSRFTRHAEPQIVPDIAFNDADGREGAVIGLAWPAGAFEYLGHVVRPLQSRAAFARQAASETRRKRIRSPGSQHGSRRARRCLPNSSAREGISHLKVFNDNTGEAAVRMKEPGLPFRSSSTKMARKLPVSLARRNGTAPKLLRSLKPGRPVTPMAGGNPATALD